MKNRNFIKSSVALDRKRKPICSFLSSVEWDRELYHADLEKHVDRLSSSVNSDWFEHYPL